MTTFVGKDATFKIGGTAVGYTQELSFELDNGRNDIKEIGEEGIVEYAWGQYSVSGSFSIFYSNYDLLNDVVTAGTTKTLSLELGITPSKYTITITNVRYGEYSVTLSIEEPVTIEVSWTGEEASYTKT